MKILLNFEQLFKLSKSDKFFYAIFGAIVVIVAFSYSAAMASSFFKQLYCNRPEKLMVAVIQVDGTVTIDGKPAQADVEINSLDTHTLVFKSQTSENGEFSVSIPTGNEYEIVVREKGFPQQVLHVNTHKIDTFTVLNIYADFTSVGYDKKIQELKKSLNEKKHVSPRGFNQNAFAEKFGHIQKESLTYKVQVGAFKFFENFNYNLVVGMPKIIRKTDNDMITRFTMGNYNTYNEALALLNIIHKNELKEAFIVAFYNGERKYLHQLIDENILH